MEGMCLLTSDPSGTLLIEAVSTIGLDSQGSGQMTVLLLSSHQCGHSSGHSSLPSEVPTRARVHKLSPGRQVLQAALAGSQTVGRKSLLAKTRAWRLLLRKHPGSISVRGKVGPKDPSLLLAA